MMSNFMYISSGVRSPPPKRTRVAYVCKYCSHRCGYFNQFIRHMTLHPEYFQEQDGSQSISGAIIESVVRPPHLRALEDERIAKMAADTDTGGGDEMGSSTTASASTTDSTLDSNSDQMLAVIGVLGRHFLIGGDEDEDHDDSVAQTSTSSSPETQEVDDSSASTTKNPTPKPYQCETCSKMFSRAGILKAHIRLHTGEKPYSCKFCPKTFRLSCACRVHTRTHTGEKPCKCPVCGQMFQSTSDVAAHKKRAHAHVGVHIDIDENTK